MHNHTHTHTSDDECTVTFPDILMFSTGMQSFPPLGFKCGPTLKFLHEEELYGRSKWPQANTCDCTLMLPTVHQVYEKFEDAMCFGIGNTRGFGFA